MKFKTYIDIARALLDKPNSPNKFHFSFIIRKNRIYSIGWNNEKKTHTLAAQFKYPYPMIHAELDAIVKFREPHSFLEKCFMVNVRIRKDGRPTMSRPCKNCRRLLQAFGLKSVFYTDYNGGFQELVPGCISG